jgi:hypothetical protein
MNLVFPGCLAYDKASEDTYVQTVSGNYGILGMAVPTAFADFSYQEKSTVTGGAIAGMLKVAGAFSKAAREPIETTVAVRGDRMAHRGNMHASIIDLAAETITQIDLQKKTYSVMTFEQMKAMLEQMQQKMKQNPNAGQISFKVSGNKTDNHKTIGGMDATEMILKMEMQGTDQQSGQQGGMAITTDLWIAPAADGYREVREFQRRMAEKINWNPGGNTFMTNPQVSEGMAEVYKEMSKLDGMPVFETVSMGVSGQPADGSVAAASSQPAPQTQDQQQPPSTLSGALGGALSGRLGLGRKKQQTQDQSGSAGSSSGSLLDMTVEMSGFSSSPVDPSLFEVPAGFKKIEPDSRRMQ